MADVGQVPCIYVLAGTNGAGKSSIAGAMFLQQNVAYFNPDEAARLILSANPGVSRADANAAAWLEGKRLLERAIVDRWSFAFETTLGLLRVDPHSRMGQANPGGRDAVEPWHRSNRLAAGAQF